MTLRTAVIVIAILVIGIGSLATAPGDPREISRVRARGHHLRFGWRAFRAHRLPFIAATLVLFVSWVILEVLVVAVTRSQLLGAVVINLALHAAFLAAFCTLLARLYALTLAVVDGAAMDSASSVSLVRRGIAVLACALLYFAIVAGGLVLFVFPGVYAAVRYAPWLHSAINAEPRDTIQSLRRAAALTKDHCLQVGRLVLACLLINLGGAALLGIGLLVTLPVSLLASASLFRALERPTSSEVGRTEPEPSWMQA